MSAPRVSVLTPVHNGERYLDECAASVVAQTFRDLEYVIVDNCSTDATPAIARRWAARDPRVRYVRSDVFVDVHASHNRAVRASDRSSSYVKFVAADDWIYPECLERMVAAADAHPSAGIVSAYRLEQDHLLHDRFFRADETFMRGREALRKSLLGSAWITGSPTSLLFRADLVRAAPEFLDGEVWHSDTDAAYRIMVAHDVAFVHQVLTFTRLHDGALTGFSHRVNTYISNDGRMLLRYGAAALEPGEYRGALRRWLRRYAWFLAKQALRPSRWRQPEFRRFHRREIAALLSVAQGDHATSAVLSACRASLGPAR